MRPDVTIRSITVHAVDVPLERPVETASGEVPTAPLVLIDVATSAGVTGRAYLFCFTRTVLRSLAQLVNDLGETIVGGTAAPRAVFADLHSRLRLLRPQGLPTMAISGIDMALWDATAQAAELPLARFLGGEVRPVRAYASLRSMHLSALADEAAEHAALGFHTFKIKIGTGELADDRKAIAVVRDNVGADADIAVDYNQGFTVPEAIRRVRALEDEKLLWVEEPVHADDHLGHARVRESAPIPIQTGESWWCTDAMAASLAAGASDFAMVDPMRIGGVTGWLEAASLARAAGVPLSSHLLPEVSAALLTVTPSAHLLEHMDLAAAVLAEPIRVVDGTVVPHERPGTGVEWNADAVARYAI